MTRVGQRHLHQGCGEGLCSGLSELAEIRRSLQKRRPRYAVVDKPSKCPPKTGHH